MFLLFCICLHSLNCLTFLAISLAKTSPLQRIFSSKESRCNGEIVFVRNHSFVAFLPAEALAKHVRDITKAVGEVAPTALVVV